MRQSATTRGTSDGRNRSGSCTIRTSSLVSAIKASSSAEENVIGVYFAEAEDPTYDVAEFYDYFDRHIKPYLERIPGVSEVDLRGGREHQVHVRVNPATS